MNDIYETGTESELWHIGTASSGRYPKGSGERPYQHEEQQRLTDHVKNLTNEEMAARIKRENLERQYNKMFYPDEDAKQFAEMQRAVQNKRTLDDYRKMFPSEEEKAQQDLKDSMKQLEDAIGSARKITKPADRDAIDRSIDYSKDLSDMSDNDLRNVINRMNMEKQYRQLIAEQTMRQSKKEQAKAKVDKVLSYAQTGMSLAVPAVTLGLAIYNAKHKK